MIDLSIIIVTWNTKDLVQKCLSKLRESKDRLNKEILVVDNGSSDGTSAMIVKEFPEVTLIESQTNLGFTRANNLAYQHAQGRYLLMLNSDAFVCENTLQESIDFMEKTPRCGVLGAHLIDGNGHLQHSCRNFPTPLRLFLNGLDVKLSFVKEVDDRSFSYDSVRECDWVVGCFLLTRKAIVDDLGFFLRHDFFMYNDDNDLCLRIKRKGWKVYFYPTKVVHLGGATAQKMGETSKMGKQVEKYQLESQFIYFRKNYHLGTVLNNYMLLILFDLFLLTKKMIRRREYSISDILKHMNLTTKVLLKTRFGAKAVH